MKKEFPECAKCPYEPSTRLCQKEDGKSPLFCPTSNEEKNIKKALEELQKPENMEFVKQASIQLRISGGIS